MTNISKLLATTALTLSIGVGCSPAYSASTQCSFTVEQDRLLKLSSSYGSAFDYTKTLPAIVMQESFVGKHIVKVNPSDGKYGSYGITHILLSTAMWLEDEDSRWTALEKIAPKLINDDLYALQLAVKKLDSVHQGNWLQTYSDYNGGSMKYALKIRDNIRLLDKCGYFNWSQEYYERFKQQVIEHT